jgi:hypothetical protein
MYSIDTLKKARHILKQIAREVYKRAGNGISFIDDQINSELNALVRWAASRQLQAKGRSTVTVSQCELKSAVSGYKALKR